MSTSAGSRRGERLAWASALTAGRAARRDSWRARIPFNARGCRRLRFEIKTPPTGDLGLAVSPDGLQAGVRRRNDGQSQLWLRSLDARRHTVAGDRARQRSPFWSPDSRSIAFLRQQTQAHRYRRRIGAHAGRRHSDRARWLVGHSDGTIIFGNNPDGPIYRVSPRWRGRDRHASGRTATTRSLLHRQFLPDGRHFLFYVDWQSRSAQASMSASSTELDAKRLVRRGRPGSVCGRHWRRAVHPRRTSCWRRPSIRIDWSSSGDPIVDCRSE